MPPDNSKFVTPLSLLAETLHLFGKAVSSDSLTKVKYEFFHSGTDLASFPMWTFSVTLRCLKGIIPQEEGNSHEDTHYVRTWEGEGDTESEAFDSAVAQVRRDLHNYRLTRAAELEYLSQAEGLLNAADKGEWKTPHPGLWRRAPEDPPKDVLEALWIPTPPEVTSAPPEEGSTPSESPEAS